ncbi:NAD(P)-binding domain-containing protein, partial [Stenotrophomonas maltophilia]|uniref:NAD(P)-binding domain-containing protein n=1 Tax=Stenotrophomonas maltophilia TaxID=40324 RepID=UPI0013DC9F14
GVVIANGHLTDPELPQIPGSFSGELMHSKTYKNAAIFDGKRVLIVGMGNTGCDIAVDAVHRAAKVLW